MEINDRKYGYPQGVRKAEELVGMNYTPRNSVFYKTWNFDDGDDGDMERYLMEQPFLSKRKKRFAEFGIKSGIMKVRVNMVENGDVGADSMYCKMAAAVKIIDQLESVGIRCQVVLEYKVRGFMSWKGEIWGMHLKITAKKAEEPLNLSVLATMFTPYFFRYWVLMFWYGNFQPHMGLGHAESITMVNPDEVILNRGDCLNEDDANDFLDNLKIYQEIAKLDKKPE